MSTVTFRHTLSRLYVVQISYFHSRHLTSENPFFPSSFPVFLVVHSGIEITGVCHPAEHSVPHTPSTMMISFSVIPDFLSIPSESFPFVCLTFSYDRNPENMCSYVLSLPIKGTLRIGAKVFPIFVVEMLRTT